MKYSKAYQALKEKYKDMVKVWPEVTDPEKFVYEDVALAAYLLRRPRERGLWVEEDGFDARAASGRGRGRIPPPSAHPGITCVEAQGLGGGRSSCVRDDLSFHVGLCLNYSGVE
ncbi:hypothetical protein J1605_009138 [Eschrichtius robustus]|uniref:tRNA (uracil-O(2)-)-methyltransferase n=1 Tax=Eschrichtius robustus TaxID=9764 RepID=A0AB34GVZ4_ESCRO|nr:hypothetical protein J1605_009138 [Eschrichtius robustus]